MLFNKHFEVKSLDLNANLLQLKIIPNFHDIMNPTSSARIGSHRMRPELICMLRFPMDSFDDPMTLIHRSAL